MVRDKECSTIIKEIKELDSRRASKLLEEAEKAWAEEQKKLRKKWNNLTHFGKGAGFNLQVQRSFVKTTKTMGQRDY